MLRPYRARSTRLDRQQRPRGRMGASLLAPQGSPRTLPTDKQTENVELRERGQTVLGYVGEECRIDQPHLLQPKLQRSSQHAEPVDHATPKIDRRSLREIFRRAADLADPKPEIDRLDQHFVVKDE